jgi:molybdopterin synthase sulfur carrier subunit
MGQVQALSHGNTSSIGIFEGNRKAEDMVTVEFLGPIAKAPIEMEAATLAEVAMTLQQDEIVSEWLSKCAVALNDTMVSDLGTALKDGDKISILPPVCGG